MSTFVKFILAVVVAVAVTLICILLGGIFDTLKVEIATAVGDFLKTYGSVIGILCGLWYFFSGFSWPIRRAE